MGQIFLAGEEAQERPALLRDVVADCPAQHWIAGLERIENRTLGDGRLDCEFDLAGDVRQGSQMWREYNADRHGCRLPPGSGALRDSSDGIQEGRGAGKNASLSSSRATRASGLCATVFMLRAARPLILRIPVQQPHLDAGTLQSLLKYG